MSLRKKMNFSSFEKSLLNECWSSACALLVLNRKPRYWIAFKRRAVLDIKLAITSTVNLSHWQNEERQSDESKKGYKKNKYQWNKDNWRVGIVNKLANQKNGYKIKIIKNN